MHTPTPKQMMYNHDQIVDIFRHHHHFIGARCSQCRKTSNVAAPGSGWFCPCGQFNVQFFNGNGEMAFDQPHYGPTREAIREGAVQAGAEQMDTKIQEVEVLKRAKALLFPKDSPVEGMVRPGFFLHHGNPYANVAMVQEGDEVKPTVFWFPFAKAFTVSAALSRVTGITYGGDFPLVPNPTCLIERLCLCLDAESTLHILDREIAWRQLIVDEFNAVEA